jgi:transcriptional regulator with XRE-family HTH domain
MFGEFVKNKRLELRITLREFCRLLSLDASNWSKTERGVLSPPKDDYKLRRIAEVLKIEFGSSLWQEMKDMAQIDSGVIPEDICLDKKVLNSLPIFFRTLRSEKPEDLDKLIEFVRKGEKGEE